MMLRNEEYLLTKNERIFEAMTIFRWRKTIGVIAQKQLEAGSFLGKQFHVEHSKVEHFRVEYLIKGVFKPV